MNCDGVVKNLAERRGERRCKPSTEGSIREGEFATDELNVALAERFYRAILTHGKPEREFPEEGGRVELPLTFDEASFASQFA